jgi:hypothetical protein
MYRRIWAKIKTPEMSGICGTESRNAYWVLMGKTEGISSKIFTQLGE